MTENSRRSEEALAALRRHYEQCPYPRRDPADERRFIRYTHIDSFACLNHYGFCGRRDFSGFRALVAGGGTGDSTILLAEQLSRVGGRVTHLDLSGPSIEVARQRARVRGLDNIDWVEGSLLDIERLDLGTFDYINCSGVLHHLESPEAGLAALTTALAEGGLLGLMLYGRYGRSEYYRVQTLMRQLAGDEPDPQRRVDLCREVLESGTSRWMVDLREGLRRALDEGGDVEIYDLFLHSRDRPYVIDEVYDLLDGADLELVHLFGDCVSWRGEGNRRYVPETWLTEHSDLRERLGTFDRRRRQAIAEILHGDIGLHVFYAARDPRPEPALEDGDNVPFLAQMVADDSYRSLHELARNAPVDTEVRCRVFSMSGSGFETRRTRRHSSEAWTGGARWARSLPACEARIRRSGVRRSPHCARSSDCSTRRSTHRTSCSCATHRPAGSLTCSAGSAPEAPRPGVQSLVTSIRRGRSSSRRGICTVSTPSFMRALMRSGARSGLSVKRRR